MRQADGFFLLSLFLCLAEANDARPRGVSPDFAKYYKSSESFTCISNPSVVLSKSQINDDFCDCPDGSDEPGTAACAHLSNLSSHSLGYTPSKAVNLPAALPGFYCKNKGHRPGYVPFTRVNDGVCDYEQCCDGSDEWAKVGGTKCEDRCKEMGKEWKKVEEQRVRSRTNAIKRRQELVTEAAKLRQEVSDRIDSLRTQIQGDEIKVKALADALAEVERQERGKVVRRPKEGGKLGTLVQLARQRIDELRSAIVEVKLQRDVAKGRIMELESILSKFKEEYNPNFNDEGTKRAVRSWEEYAARDKAEISNDARDRDLEEIVKPEDESGVINWSDWEKPEESDVDVLFRFEEYLPSSIRDWIDGKLRSLRMLLIDNGILAPATESSASRELEAARSALQAAEDSQGADKKQLQEHEEDLAKDYGADSVFRALKDKCVERDSGEYTYELCWLSKTTQKSKKGGGHTNMGNFVSFGSLTNDDDPPADGKGVGRGERVTLKYENGQHCWNGPSRSTLVVLACAEADELWKIVEEEKCVYRMEVGTPAVCELGSPRSGEQGIKDEL